MASSDDELGPRGLAAPDQIDGASSDIDMLERGLPSQAAACDSDSESDLGLRGLGVIAHPVPKKRGRPAKPVAEPTAAVSEQPMRTSEQNLFAWFRPHSDLQKAFVDCWTHTPRRAENVDNVARAVDHMFGKFRRVVGGPSALEAVALGIHEKSLPDYILEVQATSHIALNLSVESFCDYVSGCIADGSCVPVAAFTSTKNDETSVILRVENESERESWAGGQASKRAKFHKHGVVGKVLQTIAEIGFVLKRRDGQYILSRCPITVPVQVMDANTGETLRRCVDEVWDIPRLQLLVQRFLLQIHLTCNDRAGSNIRCEKFFRQNMHLQELRCRTSCDVHKVHTAQGLQFALVPGYISGLIAFALAAKNGSGITGLKHGLALLFSARLVIYRDAFPDDPGTPKARSQNAALDLFMSPRTHGAAVLKRKCVLQRMLNGDWSRTDVVEHICPPGCCTSEEETRATFATKVLKKRGLGRSGEEGVWVRPQFGTRYLGCVVIGAPGTRRHPLITPLDLSQLWPNPSLVLAPPQFVSGCGVSDPGSAADLPP
jgi:hypothetical protein